MARRRDGRMEKCRDERINEGKGKRIERIERQERGAYQ